MNSKPSLEGLFLAEIRRVEEASWGLGETFIAFAIIAILVFFTIGGIAWLFRWVFS